MEDGDDAALILDKSSLIQVGLSWDLFDHDAPNDLDSSCVLFDEFGNIVDAVYYNQLRSSDHAVVHSGDSKTGGNRGDDEVITADVSRLDQQVKVLIFSITCKIFDVDH